MLIMIGLAQALSYDLSDDYYLAENVTFDSEVIGNFNYFGINTWQILTGASCVSGDCVSYTGSGTDPRGHLWKPNTIMENIKQYDEIIVRGWVNPVTDDNALSGFGVANDVNNFEDAWMSVNPPYAGGYCNYGNSTKYTGVFSQSYTLDTSSTVSANNWYWYVAHFKPDGSVDIRGYTDDTENTSICGNHQDNILVRNLAQGNLSLYALRTSRWDDIEIWVKEHPEGYSTLWSDYYERSDIGGNYVSENFGSGGAQNWTISNGQLTWNAYNDKETTMHLLQDNIGLDISDVEYIHYKFRTTNMAGKNQNQNIGVVQEYSGSQYEPTGQYAFKCLSSNLDYFRCTNATSVFPLRTWSQWVSNSEWMEVEIYLYYDDGLYDVYIDGNFEARLEMRNASANQHVAFQTKTGNSQTAVVVYDDLIFATLDNELEDWCFDGDDFNRLDTDDLTPIWYEQNPSSTAIYWDIENNQLKAEFTSVTQDNHLYFNKTIDGRNLERFDLQVNISNDYYFDNPLTALKDGSTYLLRCNLGHETKLLKCLNTSGVISVTLYDSFNEGQIYNISYRNMDWAVGKSDIYVDDVYKGTIEHENSGIPDNFEMRGNGYSDTGEIYLDNMCLGSYVENPDPIVYLPFNVNQSDYFNNLGVNLGSYPPQLVHDTYALGGGAYRFDNVLGTAYFTTDKNFADLTVLDSGTITLWTKCQTAGANCRAEAFITDYGVDGILTKTDGGAGNKWQFVARNGGTLENFDGTSALSTTWQYVAFRWNSTELCIVTSAGEESCNPNDLTDGFIGDVSPNTIRIGIKLDDGKSGDFYIDELKVYDYALSDAEILAQMNETFGTEVAFDVTMNTSLVNNTINYNDFNITVGYNGTVAGYGSVFNCSLYVNGGLNQTDSDVDITTNQDFFVSWTDTETDWTFEVQCENAEVSVTTGVYNYKIDTVLPRDNIISPLPDEEFTQVLSPNITLANEMYDPNFFAYNLSLFCGGILQRNVFVQNLNDTMITSVNYTDSVNPSDLPIGACTWLNTLWDSHTGNIVKPMAWYFDADDNLIADGEITWEGDFIELDGQGNPATYFFISESQDRYKLKMTWDDQALSHTFNITAPTMVYLPESQTGFKGHFIYWKNERWIDHMGTNIASVDVTPLGNDKYNLVVNHDTPTDEVEFESLGSLNRRDKDTNFTILACPENWLPYYTSCTIGDNQTLYYLDDNECGTYDDLPVDNSTIWSCNYCTVDYSIEQGCFEYELIDYPVYNNYETCCNVTGIAEDCEIPANVTLQSCTGLHQVNEITGLVIDTGVEIGIQFIAFVGIIVLIGLFALFYPIIKGWFR